MTGEAQATLITCIFVLVMRVWSFFEHRSTGKTVKENEERLNTIETKLNGSLEQLVKQAIKDSFKERAQ